MKLCSFTKHTLIGILLGLILTPGFISPPAAQAQWAVFDASNYAAKLEEMQKELDRWMKTVEHYTKMYDKAVQQVYQLKRQIESMVQCRIRAIRSLDSRLKAGIFNPQQDLQDLEEYLR